MIRRFLLLWRYRELIAGFVIRNLKLKYKSSFLGFLWSLLTPLMMMVVYTFVFSFIIRIKVDYPFALFLLCGLLPWLFFANSVSMSANGIIENANLLKKVYFPREIIPISTTISNLINLLLSLIVLGLLFLFYRQPVSRVFYILPLVILFHLLFSWGVAFIVSALTVFFKDIIHILEIILTMWFYAVPIIYPLSYVERFLSEYYLTFYRLNPLVDITELYRHALLYGIFPPWKSFVFAGGISFLVFVLGYMIFCRLEPKFIKEI